MVPLVYQENVVRVVHREMLGTRGLQERMGRLDYQELMEKVEV